MLTPFGKHPGAAVKLGNQCKLEHRRWPLYHISSPRSKHPFWSAARDSVIDVHGTIAEAFNDLGDDAEMG
jgi:hypothetical protein